MLGLLDLNRCCSISARRHFALLFKNAVKIIYVVDADLPGNTDNRVVGGSEQVLCLPDAVVYQVVKRCCPDDRIKAAERLAFADAGGGGNVGKADFMHIIIRNELKHHSGS